LDASAHQRGGKRQKRAFIYLHNYKSC